MRPRLVVVVPLVIMSFVASFFIAYDAFEGSERPSRVRMTNEVTVFRTMPRSSSIQRLSPARIVEQPIADAGAEENTYATKNTPPVVSPQIPQPVEAVEAAERQPPVPVFAPTPTVEVGLAAAGSFAEVAGHAFLRGTPPPEKVLPFDPLIAQKRTNQATTRFFVTNTKGELADVFVYVKQGLTSRPQPSKSTALLEIKGGEFVPYILGLQTGQQLLVRNSDPVMHNFHTVPSVHHNNVVNRALLPHGRDTIVTFGSPEIFIKVQCDVHAWEFAYVAVVEHPFFAVTDSDGVYGITGLPPGQYTIEAVHRKAGRLSRKATLHAGASVDGLDFVFDLPSEFTQRR